MPDSRPLIVVASGNRGGIVRGCAGHSRDGGPSYQNAYDQREPDELHGNYLLGGAVRRMTSGASFAGTSDGGREPITATAIGGIFLS